MIKHSNAHSDQDLPSNDWYWLPENYWGS